MTKIELEARIAELQAELAAQRAGADVETSAEQLKARVRAAWADVEETSMAEDLTKFGIATFYGLITGTLINIGLTFLLSLTSSVMLSIVMYAAVLTAAIVFILFTTDPVVKLTYNALRHVPTLAASATATATSWFGQAKAFAAAKFASNAAVVAA